MRAFLGIDFDIETKNKMDRLQQELKKCSKKGRWKHRENFHLTLKFLGEIDSFQQEKIRIEIGQLLRESNPFQLQIGSLGRFNGRESIRALWLGLEGDLQGLNRLHKKMEQQLEKIGFQKEDRVYKPHITLGQDVVLEDDFNKVIKQFDYIIFGPILVNEIYLFKSEHIQNKLTYTKIEKFSLLGVE